MAENGNEWHRDHAYIVETRFIASSATNGYEWLRTALDGYEWQRMVISGNKWQRIAPYKFNCTLGVYTSNNPPGVFFACRRDESRLYNSGVVNVRTMWVLLFVVQCGYCLWVLRICWIVSIFCHSRVET